MARRFDHLGDVEAFVATVEHGSLTAGAVELSTTPSVISRAIARLEARLGAQLLRRTTRSLSLTETGRHYFDQSRGAFAIIDDAERAIQDHDGELSGRVRITVPSTYGHFRLPPLLAAFSSRNPKVTVEVNIASRNVDLAAENYDLAVRFGALPDSGLIARKLEDAPFCLVAAPAYLKRVGTPASLDDLQHHTCLRFVMPRTGRVADWLLRQDGADLDWTPPPRIEVSDDFVGLSALAAAGAGICQTYDFIARDRIERGELVEVLPALRGRSRRVSVLHPPDRRLTAATRALLDALAAGPSAAS